MRDKSFPLVPPAGCVADAVCGIATVMVTVVAPAPSATAAGLKVHVTPPGSPLAEKLIAAENVVAGETGVTVKV